MGKKYIVELKKNETLYKAATRESDGTAYVCSAIGTPYTEPDMEQVRKEGYEQGYENGFIAGHLKAEKSGQSFYEDGYKRGLADAWEAARKIANMPYDEEEKVFGSGGWAFITNHTASEAIEKIRQYEQEEEMDGLRQNIQTIVDQCGYTLDEIAEVLQKMKES